MRIMWHLAGICDQIFYKLSFSLSDASKFWEIFHFYYNTYNVIHPITYRIAMDVTLTTSSLQESCTVISKFTNEIIKGEVQSRITINSKERIKISLQIGSKMMKIG